MPTIIPLAPKLTAESGPTQDLPYPVGVATDRKSLYDVCIRPTSIPTEKRDTLDLLDVRHHLNQHTTMYRFRWIPTTAMLVEALNLSTPKPGHTMGRSGRGGARWGGGAERGSVGRTPLGRSGQETNLLLALQRIRNSVLNVSSEERTV